jgi:hypothetical protein
MTALLADATNLGLARMARSSGAFSHSRLLWIAEWHVRDETYQAALDCLVDAIHAHPFLEYGETATPHRQTISSFAPAAMARANPEQIKINGLPQASPREGIVPSSK